MKRPISVLCGCFDEKGKTPISTDCILRSRECNPFSPCLDGLGKRPACKQEIKQSPRNENIDAHRHLRFRIEGLLHG